MPVLRTPIETKQTVDRAAFKQFEGESILIVDDDAINRKLLLTLLDGSGITAVTAVDGLEALQRLQEAPRKFILVLMDVNMPRMNGLETTREIRNDPDLRDIPVIALTASTSPDEVEAIVQSGMNAFLDKPINISKLYRVFEMFAPYGIARKENRSVPTPDGEIFDPKQGLEYSSGNMQLYESLLRDFLETYETAPESLKEALAVEDYDTLETIIIDMEGISGTVGARRLHDAVVQLHRAINDRDRAAIDTAIDRMRAEWKRFARNARAYLSS